VRKRKEKLQDTKKERGRSMIKGNYCWKKKREKEQVRRGKEERECEPGLVVWCCLP
jgi:hypothetical protein